MKGSIERLKFKIKKFQIDLIAKPPLKLKLLLYRQFDPATHEDLAGVYEIPYINEKGDIIYYIGMTGRKFGIRKEEHESDIRLGREKTVSSKLYLEVGIDILFNDSELISVSNFYRKSIIREPIEIYIRKVMVCNDTFSFNIPNLWLELLNKYLHGSSNRGSHK